MRDITGPFEGAIEVSATADTMSGGRSWIERFDLLVLLLSNSDTGRGKSTSEKGGLSCEGIQATRRRNVLVYSLASSNVFSLPCEWEEG